ncbi:MAG: glycosyltransferase family 4 protein [Ruminococcaceae bacterium]|nr:glycosyltransferase family 4 protein [Oscillospiraceae bacterium]
MKLLKLTAYYPPENIPGAIMQKELETAFTESGIDTKIITPYPTRGCDEETYQKYRGTEVLHDGHVEIYRFPLQRESKRTLSRAWRYLCGHIKQYRCAAKEKDVDLVMAGTTPPTQILLARKVAKKLKKPYVLRIQDIFPESMVTAGMTKEGSLIYKIGNSMMKKAYADADKIMVIGEEMKETLLKKGVPEDKIEIVRNWIDVSEISHVTREDNSLMKELGLDDKKFYVVYAGNLGKAQDVITLVRAAQKLESYTDIRFVIFGEGVEKENIDNYIAETGMTNISLYPLQSKERVSEVYSIADVSAILCKKGAGKAAVPSKTWSILGTATPIIACFDEGELTGMINRVNCGYTVLPEDEESLKETILKAYANKKDLCKLGENGRKYVAENLSSELCLKQYVSVIKDTQK